MAALFAATALAGCAAGLGGLGGPASGGTAQPITQSDRQQGAQAHPQLLAEFGGLYQGPQAAYVTSVGRRIAVQSGLSNTQSAFTISLLNSPVNNAFAIPGGYVYVTRQLTALMNDEAELAGVLGHEVGHVAARHSAARQSAATQNSLLGALGQLIVGAVAGDSGLGQTIAKGIGQGAQLLTLRFSRSQELQADDLGIRYLTQAGYDPTAMSTVLASLAAQNALDARVSGAARSVPEWASTHPDPASRVQRALQTARASGVAGGTRNADAFLTAIDGMLYGDDPRQGVVDGRTFRHPDLRLQFSAPQGFGLSNGATAVTVSGQGGQAQFTTARYSGNLSSYVGGVLRSLAGEGGSLPQNEVRTTTVNGIPAAYTTVRASTQSGQVDVTVFAYQFSSSQAYHFVAITPTGQAGVFNGMFQSVRRLSTAEAGQIRARRIDVVTVRAGDTAQSLSRRMAYADQQLERFLVLNGLGQSEPLRAGQRVKLVVY
ncbi:peptidase M48 Ste24p [Sphingomonas gilva]|uniref:Peptidase M48 Ste24p n=1 Tax=Sphingomonas gilva TaxID=2305907 RepID=A0A396RLB9_9SPHN|nr:M48 family metalloprotease [Sphingomonas gilva]RHW17090.1 peptidase M48 Ste24p [Sphingomonas gilva]